jgi:hypothetical protein
MKLFSACIFSLSVSVIAALALLQGGCDISNGSDVIRNVSINVNGTYVNDGGIPERQSGAKITRLSILQTGDELNIVDNEGTRWTGRINNAGDNNAAITLRGMTTTGIEVVITGSISVSGTTATLSGLWVEPGLTAAASATASVAAAPTATPGPTVSPTSTPTP